MLLQKKKCRMSKWSISLHFEGWKRGGSIIEHAGELRRAENSVSVDRGMMKLSHPIWEMHSQRRTVNKGQGDGAR